MTTNKNNAPSCDKATRGPWEKKKWVKAGPSRLGGGVGLFDLIPVLSQQKGRCGCGIHFTEGGTRKKKETKVSRAVRSWVRYTLKVAKMIVRFFGELN